MSNWTKIGVVGAGTMGSAIAQHLAMKGLEVTLVDLSSSSLDRGMALIRKGLEQAKERKLLDDAQMTAILGRLKPTAKLSDLSDRELVIEAVFEDLGVKKSLFCELEGSVSRTCVLATNTSSFLVSDIAEGLKNPERVVGAHYFYHAAKNKLVEVIAGKQSSPEIVAALYGFYESIDKIPIHVGDAPGFAVNRYFVPWLNEAARLYEEGKGSISFIDETARNVFGVGMGPFALMNATGVPIAQHAAQGLADKLGAYYAPSEILKKQVASKKDWSLDDTTILAGGSNNAAEITTRLLAASLGIAAQLVSEGVADAAATDLGARVGLRWPKGPFEMIEEIGASKFQEMTASYFKKWKLSQPKHLPEIQWVQSSVVGECGVITFSIPDRMNPLSEKVMEQLCSRFDELTQNPTTKRIVITGRGKAFVAGGDVKFFLDCAERGDLDRLYRFTKFGQEVFSNIANSKKPTIAYLDGLTLGGGLELALACQYRFATARAMLAFPETGIGLYPGLGGTQRAPRLIGKGLGKFLIATGQFLDAKTALAYGLVDQLIDRVTDLGKLAKLPLSHSKPATLPEAEFESFDGKVTPELFAKEPFKKYEKALRRKAPLVLQKAMELVDRGTKGSLETGLQMELDSLHWVFKTQDVKIGLSSVLTKSKPEFTGK